MKTEEMGQLMKKSEVFRDRELLYLERGIYRMSLGVWAVIAWRSKKLTQQSSGGKPESCHRIS